MRSLILAVAIVASTAFAQTAAAPAQPDSAAPAQPAAGASATAAKYSTDSTDIGTLLDNAATKAILVKYLPEVVNSDQIDMARNMTLKQIQPYATDTVTDAKLAQIDAELAKLPN
jgi:para-nitrobenzyl esterase